MKTCVVLSMLVVAVLARPNPKQVRCVAPQTWEAATYVYDHHTNYYAFGHMAYDSTGKQVRFAQRVDENSTVNAYDTLSLYEKKARYTINLKTRKCTKEPLNEPFRPVEIHENSTYVGDAIIGTLDEPENGVIVQTWTHQSADGSGLQVFTTNGCLPVEEEYRGKNSAGEYIHVHFSFGDITPGVSSPEIFDVPKECM